MNALLSQTLVTALTLLLLIGPIYVAASLLDWRKKASRQRRRSPLTQGLLRTPGHALREAIEKVRDEIMVYVAMLTFLPALPLAVLYVQWVWAGRPVGTAVTALLMFSALVAAAHCIRKMWGASVRLDRLRLGLDAELAAGQELDQLMRQGAVVFHDVPGDNFNIDHVVISLRGVFAVETKGFSKPKRSRGAEDATVVFDGKGLQFPEWSSNRQVDQAKRQATWLSRWLRQATGHPVHVTPVIALPGWFVERKGRGDVLVFSGKELGSLLKARLAQPLSAEAMQRVIYQLEQRCRDVEPNFRDVAEDAEAR